MAAYDLARASDARAYQLVVNGPVIMYWRRRVLDETVAWLREAGYQIVEIDAGEAGDNVGLLDALARALDFPAYFGRNLDALNDCLRDVVAGSYGFDLDTTGLVLVLRRYDTIAARDQDFAFRVLDIVATQCRDAALLGRRLMCLVQSDDPQLRFAPVGATPVLWNDAERLDSARGG